MSFPLSLSQQDYEALIYFARKGATTEDEQRKLETFLVSLEKNAGITRYFLWVQWQEMKQPLPPTAEFPAKWPPELRHRIELITRAISRSDVEAVLDRKASQPTNVVVTADPAGIVGWQTLDNYFAAG